MKCTNIVVLGAGYAGVTAAIRLARAGRGRVQVTLVAAGEHFVERIRLHERAAGRSLPRRSLRALLGDRVRLVPSPAAHVDREASTVRTEDGTVVPWDRLVLALGSRTDLSTPGSATHAHALDGRGSEALAARLPALAERGGRVVVVGGGLTGIEAASEVAEAWPRLRVILVTRGELGEGFSRRGTAHLRRVLERLGVEILTGATVTRVEEDRIVTAGELPVTFDACVWTPGFVGATLPAGLEGLATNARGQVLVDPYLRSLGDPRLSVAGDLAVHAVPPPIPVPTGCKSASAAGAHVADNLLREQAGRRLAPQDYAAPAYCVSLGRRDAVVQRAAKDGSLHGGMVTGWLAVVVKALIVKSTIWQIALERLGLASYGVFVAGNVPALGGGPPRGQARAHELSSGVS